MRQEIRKLGTIDADIVETTPFIFHDRLIRFETIQTGTPWNHTGRRYLRCVDVESGEIYPPFCWQHSFASAYAEGDVAWVFAACEEVPGLPYNPDGGKSVHVFRSGDLCDWDMVGDYALENEGRLFNTSVCKTENKYVMAYETDDPAYPPKFTLKFAESTDLVNWKKIPPALFGKDFYVGGPTLRYCDGWFYILYVDNRNCEPPFPDWFWQTSIARSRDLVNWDFNLENPIMVASPEDRVVLNPDLRLSGRETNINNSDLEFCEFNGKLVMFYSWGDQLGVNFLAQAEFKGTEKEFLEGFFL